MIPQNLNEESGGGLLIRDLLAVARWLTGNHTGTSSKYMLAVAICGQAIPQRFGDSTPQDEPDLQRCLALIELAPSVRNCFPVLRTASPVWAAFVDHWDEMAVLSEENDYAATTGRMNALRSSANTLLDHP